MLVRFLTVSSDNEYSDRTTLRHPAFTLQKLVLLKIPKKSRMEILPEPV